MTNIATSMVEADFIHDIDTPLLEYVARDTIGQLRICPWRVGLILVLTAYIYALHNRLTL